MNKGDDRIKRKGVAVWTADDVRERSDRTGIPFDSAVRKAFVRGQPVANIRPARKI